MDSKEKLFSPRKNTGKKGNQMLVPTVIMAVIAIILVMIG